MHKVVSSEDGKKKVKNVCKQEIDLAERCAKDAMNNLNKCLQNTELVIY